MLEILVVFVLVAIISSMSFSSYRTWQKHVLLTNTRDEIKSALVRAQQYATAAAGNSSWGMHLATSSYTMFVGDFYNENSPENKTWTLSGVEIVNSYSTFSDGAGDYSADVVFSKFDGDTYNTGTVSIIISEQPSFSKSVIVQSSGQID